MNINKRLKYTLPLLLHLSQGIFNLIQNHRGFGYGFWYSCFIEVINNYFLVAWQMFIQITIQGECKGFKLGNFDVILMSAGSIPSFNWPDTSFENQSLYWFCINYFAALFTLISKGWNLNDQFATVFGT